MRTLLLFILMAVSFNAAAQSNAELWDAVRSGDHFIMMRHALAPGTGDPSDFELRDCSTQRNLSDEGRSQAKKIGRLLKSNGILNANVYSSEWCRCMDTAELLNFGRVTKLPAINSFFQNYDQRGARTRALSDWLDDQFLNTPLILVTHQVNITAFTEVFPESGELVFIKREEQGEYTVVGTIETL